MASNSKSRGDTKKLKIKNSPEMPALVALSEAAENFDLVKSSDSFHYEKVKDEIGPLNKEDSSLRNNSSTSIKIPNTAKTSPSAIEKVTVKKEASNEEESFVDLPAYTPTPIKAAKVRDVEVDEASVNNTTGGSQPLSDGNKKEGHVISLAVKSLSDEERRLLRAKRFNIIVADSCPNDKQENMAQKVTIPPYKNASGMANYPTPTYDILKKRAERFGENVSTVMKSLDYKEKMLKRKLKFLESVTNLKELEIKKRRAEKFRMV